MDTINTAVAKVPTPFDGLAHRSTRSSPPSTPSSTPTTAVRRVHNAGDAPGWIAVYAGDGAAAVAAFDAKAAAAKASLADAVAAAHDLEEALR